jgi:hypothetical protein
MRNQSVANRCQCGSKSTFIQQAAIFTIGLLTIAPDCAAQSIEVGSAIQVSAANFGLSHYEVIIAADPKRSNLLACSIVDPAQPSRDLHRDIAYLSSDGGHSWSPTLEIAGGIWAADPSCAFGPDGTAFFAAIVFDSVEGKYKGKTVLYTSTDAGKRWQLAFTFPEEGDREFLTVDRLNHHIYMIERRIGSSLLGIKSAPIVLYDSDDGGASFDSRAIVPTSDFFALPAHPGGVLSDGTFITSISDFGTETSYSVASDSPPVGELRALLYNRARNDDLSFSIVGEIHKCNSSLTALPMPSLAVDASGGIFNDRVYIAWPDSRSGRCEILFSMSADGGKTWSPAGRINDDPPTGDKSLRDDFQPVLAVNMQGVVGIVWYDRRNNANDLGWEPRFSASLDGGETFLPSASLGNSEISFPSDTKVHLMARSRGGGTLPLRPGGPIQSTLYCCGPVMGGETAGLAADANGVFHALWVANPTGTSHIWTTYVKVDGTVMKHGSRLLAELDDISRYASLLFSDVQFDLGKRTITATAYIQNTSSITLVDPVKVRILRLYSRLGVPELMNSDNKRCGAGAVFDFSESVRGHVLKPGQNSDGRQITIHFDHLDFSAPPLDYRVLETALTLDAVVLGKESRLSTRPHHESAKLP